jgi:hypothetical protein
MAVQELAQAKNEDPLPLRKAKLTQDAVVRKLAKVTAAAQVVTEEANNKAAAAKDAANQATLARVEAEKKREEAELAVVAVKNAIAVVQEQIQQVSEELDRLKASPSNPLGLLWYKSRQLEEKKKSLPTRMW